LHHVASRPELRDKVLDALLPELAGSGGRHITILNEPETDGLVTSYLRRGFKETMRQLELRRPL
jgi:hypothetical protein